MVDALVFTESVYYYVAAAAAAIAAANARADLDRETVSRPASKKVRNFVAMMLCVHFNTRVS